MTNHSKRIKRLEQAKRASKGKRYFLQRDDCEGITERGEPRTLDDIVQAKAEGYACFLIDLRHEVSPPIVVVRL